MKYFGFLLSIPMVAFASFEDSDLSAKEQTAYRIEEKEMFAKDDFHEQIAKMFVSYEMDEEDSFSLFEEDCDASSNGCIGDEVTQLDENTCNELSEIYADEDTTEFYPSKENIPQRSNVIQSRPRVARQNPAAVHQKQAVKQKNYAVAAEEQSGVQSQRKAQTAPQKAGRVQKKQQQQPVVMEESQIVEQPQKKAPAKKKVSPARAPVVQNGQKAAQAPTATAKRKAKTATKGGNVAQKKAVKVRKGHAQRGSPNATVRRPAVEIEELEE